MRLLIFGNIVGLQLLTWSSIYFLSLICGVNLAFTDLEASKLSPFIITEDIPDDISPTTADTDLFEEDLGENRDVVSASNQGTGTVLVLRKRRATDQRGCPVPSLTASQTIGRNGNILLQDSNLIEHLAHFNRERIPERSAHAKGSGAFGYFKSTKDSSEFTKAKLFNKVGKKTRVFVRFSTGIGESGSSEVVQELRGFAVKFYTEDGNWDLTGNNLPNFQIRDPILFPLFQHARRRHPSSHLKDPNARWDFDTLRPETAFNSIFQMSGLGSPYGYRHMDGFGIHTFKLVNLSGKKVYCKFHWKTDQGIRNVTREEERNLDPDYATKDLYDAIEAKRYPSWTFSVQIMTFEQAATYRWNPFDITKIWLEKDFPLTPIGKIVLNRNPKDYFTEVEQSAFGVNMIPGIEPSPDKMLHSRMFAYADAHRYRLGANLNLIEVNRPLRSIPLRTYVRDGLGCSKPSDNGNGRINYFPNSFDRVFVDPNANESAFHVNADVIRADTGDDDNFSQAGYYWRNEFDDSQRKVVVENIVRSIKSTHDYIQKRVIKMFSQVDNNMGIMLRNELNKAKAN